jgi:hypothetical protein
MKLASVAALVSALGLCCGLARADTPQPPSPPPGGGSAVSPAPAVQHLNDASLKAMLENLGYEPKALQNKDGSNYYQIKAGPWAIEVSLNANQKNLWFVAWLEKIPAGGKIPPDRLLTLLSENWKNDPVHFCYDDNNRFLTLTERIENRDVTPQVFRGALDGFTNVMSRTSNEWNVSRWLQTPTDQNQTPKAAPAPESKKEAGGLPLK